MAYNLIVTERANELRHCISYEDKHRKYNRNFSSSGKLSKKIMTW